MDRQSKIRFFIRNLARGLLTLTALIILFLYAKKYLQDGYLDFLAPIYENPLIVFVIYTISEVVLGIIPPELFFIWALRVNELQLYVQYVIFLAFISYFAGILGYWIGKKIGETVVFRWIKRKYLRKSQVYLQQFGFFLIIVAALTPLPFSGISMLMGSVGYPFRKFWVFALTRFIRYAAYAFIFWEVNTI
ncbi:YqaA family protein [Bacteroidota bacterium]